MVMVRIKREREREMLPKFYHIHAKFFTYESEKIDCEYTAFILCFFLLAFDMALWGVRIRQRITAECIYPSAQTNGGCSKNAGESILIEHTIHFMVFQAYRPLGNRSLTHSRAQSRARLHICSLYIEYRTPFKCAFYPKAISRRALFHRAF